MGSFDIYCSLCCGTLYEVEIGGKSKEQRQVRQRLIAKKIQELQAQSERSGLAMAGEQLGNENAAQYTQSENVLVSEEEDEDSWEIQREMDGNRGYDPDIVSEESTKWLRVVHVLGYNPTAMGLSKCVCSSFPEVSIRRCLFTNSHRRTYISGEGTYSDFVCLLLPSSRILLQTCFMKFFNLCKLGRG